MSRLISRAKEPGHADQIREIQHSAVVAIAGTTGEAGDAASLGAAFEVEPIDMLPTNVA